MSQTILVFGSNREGRHGKGAALYARQHYGAVYGKATGMQGRSYAIVTKELRRNCEPVTLAEVDVGVADFIRYAQDNRDLDFYVTPIGCGLAGFKPDQIGPMFAIAPDNVYLCPEFAVYRNAAKPFNPLNHEQTK